MIEPTTEHTPVPDAEMIATYAEVVFGWCEGWVAVRALAEKGGPDRPPHTPFLPADADLAAKLTVQARWAAEAGMALFVIPGTVGGPGQASADDVAQMQVVLTATSPPSARIWCGISARRRSRSPLAG